MINKNTNFLLTDILISASPFYALNYLAVGTPDQMFGTTSDFFNREAHQHSKNDLRALTNKKSIAAESEPFAVSNFVGDNSVKKTPLVIGFDLGEDDFWEVIYHD